MLQRSPSYVLPLPAQDPLANWLRRLLGDERAYAITRRKNILPPGGGLPALPAASPTRSRRLIRRVNAKQLRGRGCDVDVHFKPAYDPWDQRLCAVPDGDLFRRCRAGQRRRSSPTTSRRSPRPASGCASGRELEADVVVTATGLNLLAFGGMRARRRRRARCRLPDTVAYKGDDAQRRAELRLRDRLHERVVDAEGRPRLRAPLPAARAPRRDRQRHVPCREVSDPAMPTRPLLDFKAGYVLRALDRLPAPGRAGRRGSVVMSYADDVKALRHGDVDDGALRFSRAGARRRRPRRAVEVAA